MALRSLVVQRSSDQGTAAFYGLKVAVILASDVGSSVHGSVPGHDASLQPTKVEPSPGVAVRVTVVLGSNSCEHAEVQLIPAGALVTVPDPTIMTESVTV